MSLFAAPPQPFQGIGVEDARHFIEKIAVGHGYIAAETLAAMPPDVRRLVEEALKKDTKSSPEASQLVQTLAAGNINVAYELLSNADGNEYKRAQSSNDTPGISFVVCHDRVYIESNEDGFSESDIKALCDFNKSSKSGCLGYLGQPGVGFKSVFTIASKVHIESGPYSFDFQHEDGDSGFGMVRPLWAAPVPLPDHAKAHGKFLFSKRTTRITLHLRNDNRDQLRERFIEQLWETPETVLLFMKHVRTVKITVLNMINNFQRSKEFQLEKGIFGSGVHISTTKKIGITQLRTWNRYHIYRSMVDGLPANTNRRPGPTGLTAASDSQAEVVLAFPVDDQSEPVIEEKQQVFAFMPLKQTKFSFLIHSDFVTDASRQDIYLPAQRNIALRQGVFKLLWTAIQDLSKLPVLEHRWMRYLPRESELASDPFWKDINAFLRPKIIDTPIIRPGSQIPGKFHKIEQLCRLTESQKDKSGRPLVPDLEVERYVSAGYKTEDLDILAHYGLTDLPMWTMISRLQVMSCSDEWKTKTFDLRDEDWHSRLARLILVLWNDTQHDWTNTIKGMPLLPLKSREFKAASDLGSGIYLPDVDGVPIPQDLDIAMILPAAAANEDCRTLYDILGVKTVDPDLVRTMIMSIYQDPGEVAKLDALKSKSHLHFLYRMEPTIWINKDEQELVIVFDQKDRVKHPRREFVYLHGEGEWSPGALLSPPFEPGIPEPDASLIHPVYLEDPPSPSEGNDKSWTDWLFNIIYCEQKVQLFTTREPAPEVDKEYSPEYLYIIRTRPEQALARLMLNFKKPEVKKLWLDDEIGSKLMRTTEFLCTDNVRRSLEESFLPLASLTALCETNSAKIDHMPFLKLKGQMEEADMAAWMEFAGHFGIGMVQNIRFTLAMVGAAAKNVVNVNHKSTKTMSDLYLKLHSQYSEATPLEKPDLQRQIRNYFKNQPCILCDPAGMFESQRRARLATQRMCLWDAPENMTSLVPLKRCWAPALERMALEDQDKIADFFHKILGIRNTTPQDIISELGELSRSSPGAVFDMQARVIKLYSLLVKGLEHVQGPSKTITKQRFRDTPLIYVLGQGSKQWFKASECVWSSDDANKDEVCLEKVYPWYSSFFLNFLGLLRMSAGLTRKLLEEAGRSMQPVPDIKELLWSVNEMLIANKDSSTLLGASVPLSRIFPVKLLDGTVELLIPFGEFCINDRPQYANALKGKVQLLDFTAEEVNRLKPLIEWANLTNRYLSKTVTEKTSVEQSQGVEDKAFAQDIINKAAAFFSIADHFGNDELSIRRHGLQTALRRIQVFRHADIKSNLNCSYWGRQSVTVPLGRGELHFETSPGSGWQIYLPQDDEDRDVCITSRLPRELAAQLLGCSTLDVDPNAVIVTASILQAKLNSVGRILMSHGITLLDISPKDGENLPETPRKQQGTVFGFAQGGPSQAPTRVLFGSPPPVVSPPRSHETADSPYQALLIQAVNVARVAAFPDKSSSFDMTAITLTLQSPAPRGGAFRFYVGDQTEWQRMVGAAGELYVFELLSRHTQALPGFSRDNWQSTVRHFVNVHPDYTTLEDWHGAEKGDLFFDDVAGTFTSYLIETGYLEENWRSERPEYYIEVKTTTSSRFETPFYMSKYQYARMQSYVNSTSTANSRKKVYILFRVYGLESGQVGVRIYVNLEASRANGELDFEAQSWTITPRARAV